MLELELPLEAGNKLDKFTEVSSVSNNFLVLMSQAPLNAQLLESLFYHDWEAHIDPVVSPTHHIFYTFKKIHNEPI